MVSYKDFLSSPNKAQVINRGIDWTNLNNNAMASNNSWLIGLTSALQSGLGMYDAMKSRDQEKEATAKYGAYNKNIADALKGKDYEGAVNLANLYGLTDEADKYYQMGLKERDYNDTMTQRNFDNDITTGREERADKQLNENIRKALVGEDLSNRQFEENKAQNKFKNDLALSQFDYSKSQDEIANALRQNQFDYQKQRDLTSDAQRDRELELKKISIENDKIAREMENQIKQAQLEKAKAEAKLKTQDAQNLADKQNYTKKLLSDENLDRLKSLNENAGRWANSWTKGLSSMAGTEANKNYEEFNQAVRQMFIPELKQKFGGQLSDSERETFFNSLGLDPTLDPQTRWNILETELNRLRTANNLDEYKSGFSGNNSSSGDWAW